MTPPIYELMGRDRLEGLDGGKREQLVDAITGGIAVGYLAMAGIEVDAQAIDPRTDVDPAEIWKLWVVRLGSTLLDETGLPRSIQDDVTNARRATSRPGSETLTCCQGCESGCATA